MKKIWIKLIIGVVIVIVVAVGIRFALRNILTGERIGKITEKVAERVTKKAAEMAEKVQVEEAKVTEEEAEAPAKKVSPGKMNDDIWVEIFAYTRYRTIYADEIVNVEEGQKIKTTAGMVRAAEKYAKDIDNMFKKFGVTGDEYGAYTEKIGKNPEHYAKLVEKAGKRFEELEKAKK